MTEQQELLEMVEDAERATPVCQTCGEPTVPVAHEDGSVWLECSSLTPSKGLLHRLVTLDFAMLHTRRLIVGREDVALAA